MLALTAIDRGSITIAKRGGGIRHPWHVPRESLHVQYFACWAPNFKLNMTGEYSELTTEEYSTEGRKCLVYKENNLYVRTVNINRAWVRISMDQYNPHWFIKPTRACCIL